MLETRLRDRCEHLIQASLDQSFNRTGQRTRPLPPLGVPSDIWRLICQHLPCLHLRMRLAGVSRYFNEHVVSDERQLVVYTLRWAQMVGLLLSVGVNWTAYKYTDVVQLDNIAGTILEVNNRSTMGGCSNGLDWMSFFGEAGSDYGHMSQCIRKDKWLTQMVFTLRFHLYWRPSAMFSWIPCERLSLLSMLNHHNAGSPLSRVSAISRECGSLELRGLLEQEILPHIDVPIARANIGHTIRMVIGGEPAAAPIRLVVAMWDLSREPLLAMLFPELVRWVARYVRRAPESVQRFGLHSGPDIWDLRHMHLEIDDDEKFILRMDGSANPLNPDQRNCLWRLLIGRVPEQVFWNECRRMAISNAQAEEFKRNYHRVDGVLQSDQHLKPSGFCSSSSCLGFCAGCSRNYPATGLRHRHTFTPPRPALSYRGWLQRQATSQQRRSDAKLARKLEREEQEEQRRDPKRQARHAAFAKKLLAEFLAE